MGQYTFRLPDVGEGVAEAEIVSWYVKVGVRLDEDQAMVDVMTDKATVELTSPVAGVITALHGQVGEMVPVGSSLIELLLDSSEAASPATLAAAPVPEPRAAAEVPSPAQAPFKPATAPVAPKAAFRVPVPAAFTTRPAGDLPLAAPATRKRAYELGIPLQFVSGTGPAGRITPEDFDAYIASGGINAERAVAGPVQKIGVTETKIIGLRRKIAEKMQDAKRRIPHIGYVEEFDMTELEALRKDLNDNRAKDQPKLTLLPFLMRAIVKLVLKFPQVNSRYDDDAGILRAYEGVHIGIATQTPGGLMVPVVRHAEALDIWSSATELTRVTTAARNGSAARDELMGSTITITSLGPLGGISATPVINHPEVAIICPNKLVERPVVLNGQIMIRTMMNMSSSFDHRIVDGYDAAQFVHGIKRLVERPALLFVE